MKSLRKFLSDHKEIIFFICSACSIAAILVAILLYILIWPAPYVTIKAFISKHLEKILVGVIISVIVGFMPVIVSKLLDRHFAKRDRKEQQYQKLKQKKEDVQKQLKICLEKIITDWEDQIKSESLEKEMNIRRKRLQDNGIKLKEVVADNEEYLSGETVKEALDIAREIKETSTLNILTFSVNKPHDEQPDVIFKERGGRVVERAKELIKRL